MGTAHQECKLKWWAVPTLRKASNSTAQGITLAIHLEDRTAVRQSVEQRGRHPLALKDRAPLAERQVTRQKYTAPFVPIREQLEQQFRTRNPQPHELSCVNCRFPANNGH